MTRALATHRRRASYAYLLLALQPRHPWRPLSAKCGKRAFAPLLFVDGHALYRKLHALNNGLILPSWRTHGGMGLVQPK